MNVSQIEEYLSDGGVAVIPGFQGISSNKEITSIGREVLTLQQLQ